MSDSTTHFASFGFFCRRPRVDDFYRHWFALIGAFIDASVTTLSDSDLVIIAMQLLQVQTRRQLAAVISYVG